MAQVDTSTAAQKRLVEELLGWGQPRPPAPVGFASRLLRTLEETFGELQPALAAAADQQRRRRLLISKTRLDRLSCDGWQLAPAPYEHTTANARGVLAHEAIAADWDRGRTQEPDELVAAVWHEVVTRRPGDPSSLSAFLNDRTVPEARSLRAEVAQLLGAFREVWPALPRMAVRLDVERPVEVALAGGAVVLRGVPDLVIHSTRSDDRARSLVVDLKTGRPRSEHDRHELRFYALLLALYDGRPPFRWATFYVTEGRAEAEDLREETLELTALRVIDGVRQFVRLDGMAADAPEGDLELTAGLGCYSCLRRTDCSVAGRDLSSSRPD